MYLSLQNSICKPCSYFKLVNKWQCNGKSLLTLIPIVIVITTFFSVADGGRETSTCPGSTKAKLIVVLGQVFNFKLGCLHYMCNCVG